MQTWYLFSWLLLTTLTVCLSSLTLSKPALPPWDRYLAPGCAGKPCCLSVSSSQHPSMDKQPRVPNLPPGSPHDFPASTSNGQLSSAPLQNRSAGKPLHVSKSLYKKGILLLWFIYHSNAYISATYKPWLPSYTHYCVRMQQQLLDTYVKGIKVTAENILRVETLFA